MPHALFHPGSSLPVQRSNALLTGACALLTLLLPAATLLVITTSSGMSRAFAEPNEQPVQAEPTSTGCPSTDALSSQCTTPAE